MRRSWVGQPIPNIAELCCIIEENVNELDKACVVFFCCNNTHKTAVEFLHNIN